MTNVAGQFHIRVVNAETGKVREERKFNNLVTNIGLEYYARGWPGGTAKACVVGTGTSIPSPEDTLLGLEIARKAVGDAGQGINIEQSYRRFHKYSCRFNAGAISNTITEIGIVGTSRNILWCRQLILDEQGQPSALPVLPNEYLDVTYTSYTYPNLQDTAFSFVMDGVTYNGVRRLARAERKEGDNYAMQFTNIVGSAAYATQTLGPITGLPSGDYISFGTSGSFIAWDANTPYSRSNSLTLALGVANVSGGIGSLVVRDTLFYHQISFDPVLPKDNTKTMTLIFSDTVSRYSAP